MSKKTQSKKAAAAPAPAVVEAAPAPKKAKLGTLGASGKYPLPDVQLELVAELPKGLGADQRGRWGELQAALKALPKGESFTAAYIGKVCPGGRRTLRRAVRAKLIKGWGGAEA